MHLLRDFWRFLRASFEAVWAPINKARNVAHAAVAVLGIIGTPVFVTVLAEQISGIIARWTGLYLGLIPWVAFGLTFSILAVFLAWRTEDRRVTELEKSLIPEVAHEWLQENDLVRLRLTNMSDKAICDCQVVLLDAVEIGGEQVFTDTVPFWEDTQEKTIFAIPPRGVALLVVASTVGNPGNPPWLATGDRRKISYRGRNMGSIPFMNAKLNILVQAANIRAFPLTLNLREGRIHEPS